MLLTELLAEFNGHISNDKCVIHGLAIDSRKIKPGELFFAYPGENQDGRLYINQAIQNGAAAIVYENTNFAPENSGAIPLIPIKDLREKVGAIAARFYNYPSRKMQIIGITGTNGKTSCSQFLAQALAANKLSCAIIGTLGIGFPGKLTLGEHTTPDPITLQQQLAELQQQGAKFVAMEVSSHALQQNRVQGVDFSIAVFTNLTHDHLDYHGDMQSYAEAKNLLFERPELKHAVINYDDDFGKQLIEKLANKIDITAYSINNIDISISGITANHIKTHSHGFSANIITPDGAGDLQSKLLGEFNLSNLLAVLAVLLKLNISFESALYCLSKIKTIPGRMQTFGGGKQPLVVVDYAHTPDALAKVLIALRKHCQGRLWSVFGCGGDRDRAKRQLMAEVAERYSDHIIITNDNPRTESPEQIVQDIQQGLLCPWGAEIEYNREAAIAHAIDCAEPKDIVLIAGKGHEPYQIIGTEKLPYSDIETVKQQLSL